MAKKILFPIFLLLVAVIGIGCVSAADNTTASDSASQMTMAPQVIPNENADLNATVISEAPQSSSDSQLNNNTSGPKLDIKGPKLGDHPIIKGPINPKIGPDPTVEYNFYLKSMLKSTNHELNNDVVCKLLLKIYKDNDAGKTKDIAYKILKKNNFNLTSDDINQYFNAISGSLDDRQCYNAFKCDKSFFDDYIIQKRLIDSDKIQVSDSIIDKYGKNYDGVILELILKVYTDYSESMAVKIVTKIVNNYEIKHVQRFGVNYVIDDVYSTDMVKKILNDMIDGRYGNHYFFEMKKAQLSKIANSILIIPILFPR